MTRLRMAVLTGMALVTLVAATDLSGRWQIEADFDDTNVPGGGFDCTLTQDGNRLAGTCGNRRGARLIWRVGGR